MDERNLRKTRVGTVVSNKMDKTVVVAIKDNVKHPLYKKIMKRTVTFKARLKMRCITRIGFGSVVWPTCSLL